jgi:Fe2+ or Zn2+ uptake regulation protein
MGGSVRYDTNMGEHHHVINQQTGEIQDVDIYGDIPVPAGISRDKIKRIKITYYV